MFFCCQWRNCELLVRGCTCWRWNWWKWRRFSFHHILKVAGVQTDKVLLGCSCTLTNRETGDQAAPPLVCTPSPWWLSSVVWLSVWWALQSGSHTVRRSTLRTPRRSPETTRTHHQIAIWIWCTEHVNYVWEELGQNSHGGLFLHQYFYRQHPRKLTPLSRWPLPTTANSWLSLFLKSVDSSCTYK